jgi:hypothetical protein
MTYTLRTNLSDNPEDFIFRYFKIDAGRTYATDTPNGRKWTWSIYGLHLKRLPGHPTARPGDDLEGAQAAFKTNWEKMRLAGYVRL